MYSFHLQEQVATAFKAKDYARAVSLLNPLIEKTSRETSEHLLLLTQRGQARTEMPPSLCDALEDLLMVYAARPTDHALPLMIARVYHKLGMPAREYEYAVKALETAKRPEDKAKIEKLIAECQSARSIELSRAIDQAIQGKNPKDTATAYKKVSELLTGNIEADTKDITLKVQNHLALRGIRTADTIKQQRARANLLMNHHSIWEEYIDHPTAKHFIVELMIAVMEEVVKIGPRSSDLWTAAALNLSVSLRNRDYSRPDRDGDIARSIALCEDVLKTRTKASSPRDWATANLNLAYALTEKQGTLETKDRALVCFNNALSRVVWPAVC